MRSESWQATQTSLPFSASESPVGLWRIGVPDCGSASSSTASVAVVIRETESWSGLTTHTAEPSAVIWIGPLLNERAPEAETTLGRRARNASRIEAAGRDSAYL